MNFGFTPCPGRLTVSMSAVTTVPSGNVRGRDDRAPRLGVHLLRLLGRRTALDAVAERGFGVADVRDEVAQLLRLGRERMIGTAHRAVERVVLLDDARAERHRGDRHVGAVACGRRARPARRTRPASSGSSAGSSRARAPGYSDAHCSSAISVAPGLARGDDRVLDLAEARHARRQDQRAARGPRRTG